MVSFIEENEPNVVWFCFPDLDNVSFIIKSHVKELRLKKGLSQSNLADLIYSSQNTISSYEVGDYCPSLCNAFLLASVLCESDIDFLFEFIDCKSQLSFSFHKE